jgi:hypothetical protein
MGGSGAGGGQYLQKVGSPGSGSVDGGGAGGGQYPQRWAALAAAVWVVEVQEAVSTRKGGQPWRRQCGWWRCRRRQYPQRWAALAAAVWVVAVQKTVSTRRVGQPWRPQPEWWRRRRRPVPAEVGSTRRGGQYRQRWAVPAEVGSTRRGGQYPQRWAISAEVGSFRRGGQYPQRWAGRLGAAESGDIPIEAASSVFKVFLFSFAIREAMELLLIVIA